MKEKIINDRYVKDLIKNLMMMKMMKPKIEKQVLI